MTLPPGAALHRLADRPDLVGGLHALGRRVWPRFMQQSTAGEAFYSELGTTFADCALVLVDADGEVRARVLWIPFPWDGVLPLPDEGWDGVAEAGIAARRAGTPCAAASALEIGIDPALRGGGLSGVLLGAMRDAVAAAGLHDLFAPVRPSAKHEVPHEPMADYAARRRPDGLPVDPWLRVHVRAGGEVLGPCERSMHIEGSVADWQGWTGLDLSAPGRHVVPGALAPVTSDGRRVVYVEPNVWVRHRLT
jgi:GNAT superfamily N-acetyltransferase